MKKMLFALLSACIVFGQGQPIHFETFFSVYRVGAPAVSEDGDWIAFSVKQADIEDNSYSTHIWVARSDGSDLKQITSEGTSHSNPVFSADSRFLYYISNRSGSAQLWKQNIEDGTSEQVSDIFGGVNHYVLNSDNMHYIVSRSVPPECTNEACIRQTKEQRNNNPVQARVIDNLMYRHWNSWLDGEVSHLFLCTISDSTMIDITPGSYHTPPISLASGSDFYFSGDGNEICFVSNHDERIAISTNNDIFVYLLEDKSVTKISESKGNDHNPRYSPDNRYIAYASMERTGFEADRNSLLLYERKSKKTVNLTPDFIYSVEEIIWSPDSKNIFFTVEDAGNISVYVVSVQKKNIKPVLKGHYVTNLTFLDKKTLLFTKQSIRRPNELYTFNLKTNTLKQLTYFNEKKLAQFDLPGYEEFWFTGALEEKVHGFIMKPPGYVEGKKYPTVHLIHGGPQGMWSNIFHYRWNYQMFATPGHVVYWINFHGSRGYGQNFTDVISGHWGDYPYEDLVKATEYVVNNYDYVDGTRLAAAGASYGGFMINWIAGHDNPYKCLVSHDGVYDQVSMWGATEELWFPEWEFGGVPWQDGTTFNKWSPSRLAGNFKTPTLVIHGEHDYRVPYTQGLQMFSALQRQDIPSRLLFFPDEDHFVQKPQNARLWWKTVYEWLEEYLK
jgi:dipeptidyl aminopeptidase/acylaminoacyl peptidase